jgi:uncharacterized membrane protein
MFELSYDAGPPPLDLGRCFEEAFDVYKRNFLKLVGAAVVYQLLTTISFTLLAGPLYGGVIVMTLNAMARPDRQVRFSDLFTMRPFWALLALFYIETICTITGFVLLVVPGLLLMTIWLFPMYFAVQQGMGVGQSLSTSYRVVRRSFWPNFWLAVTVFALSIAPSFVPLGGWVVGRLIDPLAWLLMTAAYRQEVLGIMLGGPPGFQVVEIPSSI